MNSIRPAINSRSGSISRSTRITVAAIATVVVVVANCLGLAGSRATAAGARLTVEARGAGTRSDQNATRLKRVLHGGQVCFIENQGQVDSRVRYYTQGRDATIYFTSQGLTLAFTSGPAPESGGHGDGSANAGEPTNSVAEARGLDNIRRWTVKLDFLGSNRHAQPSGEGPAPTVVSYFRGPKDQWNAGLRTYSKVVYRNLWPGVDAVYGGTTNRLKCEFIVRPGADPSKIRLAYRGASQVGLTADGHLEVDTPVTKFQEEKPYSYQEAAGRRVEIATAYKLGPERNAEREYGFQLGPYDRSRRLVVDPSVVVYSGLIGGSNNDAAFHVAVDAAGNAYVAGITTSNPSEGFPATAGPNTSFTPDRGSGQIGSRLLGAFVAKVKADGTGFAYCGYIGGAGNQIATGIAVDSTGRAYVCGATDSKPAQGFPVTAGPKLTYSGGSFTAGGINDALLGDAFIARVNASGTGLDYCGYIGGEGDDFAYGVAVDDAGAAYVTGQTSSKATFPLTVGPGSTYGGDPYDAFIAKVKPDGSGFAYCGYIGGAGTDIGFGVAVDSAGSAYVTGVTTSNPASIHAVVGPRLTRSCSDPSGNCPDYDAFVAKVKADGSGFNYLGFIGGAQSDGGIAIAVDATGNAYVTGGTASDASTFGPSGGPALTLKGQGDAFVAKVKADGSGLIYNGYIGGSGLDVGTGIALDSSGNAYVVGYTQSSDLPVTDGSTFKGGGAIGDAFVAKVKTDGTGLLYAAYFGGSDDDWGLAIGLDSSGNLYVCGATYSTDFPAAVGPVLSAKGGQDGFIAKIAGIGSGSRPDFSLSLDQPAVTTAAGSKVAVNLTITRTNGFTGSVAITVPDILPRGIKVPLDSSPTTAGSLSLKIKVKGNAQSGTYPIVFTGKDDSGQLVHAATLMLSVQ